MKHVVAVVQTVLRDSDGAFAIACASNIIGSITFSLEHPVWHEQDKPERGSKVLLGDLRRKRVGWRAHYACFLRPSDGSRQVDR
jgi:hypothetical protein